MTDDRKLALVGRVVAKKRKKEEQKIEKRWARRGRQVQFLTVSHWSSVPSLMPGMIRERERRSRRKEKEG